MISDTWKKVGHALGLIEFRSEYAVFFEYRRPGLIHTLPSAAIRKGHPQGMMTADLKPLCPTVISVDQIYIFLHIFIDIYTY